MASTGFLERCNLVVKAEVNVAAGVYDVVVAGDSVDTVVGVVVAASGPDIVVAEKFIVFVSVTTVWPRNLFSGYALAKNDKQFSLNNGTNLIMVRTVGPAVISTIGRYTGFDFTNPNSSLELYKRLLTWTTSGKQFLCRGNSGLACAHCPAVDSSNVNVQMRSIERGFRSCSAPPYMAMRRLVESGLRVWRSKQKKNQTSEEFWSVIIVIVDESSDNPLPVTCAQRNIRYTNIERDLLTGTQAGRLLSLGRRNTGPCNSMGFDVSNYENIAKRIVWLKPGQTKLETLRNLLASQSHVTSAQICWLIVKRRSQESGVTDTVLAAKTKLLLSKGTCHARNRVETRESVLPQREEETCRSTFICRRRGSDTKQRSVDSENRENGHQLWNGGDVLSAPETLRRLINWLAEKIVVIRRGGTSDGKFKGLVTADVALHHLSQSEAVGTQSRHVRPVPSRRPPWGNQLLPRLGEEYSVAPVSIVMYPRRQVPSELADGLMCLKTLGKVSAPYPRNSYRLLDGKPDIVS
ncbi:hypothetical protein RRG08_015287 [Elysia crispata]|uniref:Uncharacterized protein n=1 Tax=Elysia crispata TaxID=231223 RepID=A0AAE1DML1_9GAST|nr:hypothetical protein RRG08_015287 [Elysia crispata]